jgi:hypothetical protein
MSYAGRAIPAEHYLLWQRECCHTNRTAHLPPKETVLRKKTPAARKNSAHQGNIYKSEPPIVSPQDSSNNAIKDRLIAELRTAWEELKRAKIVLSANSETTEPGRPDRVRARTSATAEYDCALNRYHRALDNLGNIVLNQVSP